MGQNKICETVKGQPMNRRVLSERDEWCSDMSDSSEMSPRYQYYSDELSSVACLRRGKWTVRPWFRSARRADRRPTNLAESAKPAHTI